MVDFAGGLRITITDLNGEIFADHHFGTGEATHVLAELANTQYGQAVGLNLDCLGEIGAEDFYSDLRTALNNVVDADVW